MINCLIKVIIRTCHLKNSLVQLIRRTCLSEELLSTGNQKNRSFEELLSNVNQSCPQAGQELPEVILRYQSGNSLVEPRGPGNDPSQHEPGRTTKNNRYDEELIGKAHQKNRCFEELLHKAYQKNLSFK